MFELKVGQNIEYLTVEKIVEEYPYLVSKKSLRSLSKNLKMGTKVRISVEKALNTFFDSVKYKPVRGQAKVSTASVVARGVVGGVIAGGIGMFVGGVTAKSKASSSLKEISIRFKLNDMNNPYQEILVGFDKDGISKEKQQEVYRLFSQLELVISNLEI